jgi:oligopeptidase A
MATLDSARALLDRLASASRAAAVKELEEVTAHAKTAGFAGDKLELWDVSFYAERLREARYDLTDEMLRPYFALPAVLDGLFGVVKRLFGVDVVPADGEAPIWHPDVRFFNVLRDGQRVASFYLDPYARAAEGKRGGAWMDEVAGRSAACAPAGQAVRLPIAHMVCNQSPPVGDKPSLMNFRECETLFHEAGKSTMSGGRRERRGGGGEGVASKQKNEIDTKRYSHHLIFHRPRSAAHADDAGGRPGVWDPR